MDPLKLKLLQLIRRLSYREGHFVLASGKESTFYVDIKNVSLHPDGALAIGTRALAVIQESGRLDRFGGVGGPTLGADPLATAISLAALDVGTFWPAFIIRKEPKKHGTSQWIEGRENLKKGSNLLIVEDVVTTGGSSLSAVEKVRAEGFTVTHLLAVLDREEGGREALKKQGIELVALSTIDEIRKAR